MERNDYQLRETAIHESGHAVAHSRLGIYQICISLKSVDIYDEQGNLAAIQFGSSMADGVELVCDAEKARDQVLAFYAGYAALVAAGYSEEESARGADNDFAEAQYLLDLWQLGTASEWKEKSLVWMREERNVAAVLRVADELIMERQLVMDQINALIEVADGELPEAEYQRCKRAFWRRSET